MLCSLVIRTVTHTGCSTLGTMTATGVDILSRPKHTRFFTSQQSTSGQHQMEEIL